MWDKFKAFMAWVYNWITVLTSMLMGALVFLPPVLDNLDLFALTARLEPQTAAAIMFLVGTLKGIASAVAAKRAAAAAKREKRMTA